MSKINLNNYEAFMLDHLEGNLSPQDTLALKAFALLHPELELNFEDELVTLHKEKLVFEGKQNLKAGFSDELVIGYLENVLEGKEKQNAELLAENNMVFKQELAIYKKTIAIADTSIVFENKESLKRRGIVVLFTQSNYIRVAAALLLLMGLWFMVSRIVKDEIIPNSDIVIKKDEVKKDANNDPLPNKVEETFANEVAAKNNVSNNVFDNAIDHKKNKKEKDTSVIERVPKDELYRNIAETDLNRDKPFIKRDTNLTLLASNTAEEKIAPKYIIEEGMDEEVATTKPKSKLWNITSGLLKRLNKKGLENVNSSENNNEMFIGALTISKPN